MNRIEKGFLREESREFVVDHEKKRIWAVLLDLLQEFTGVCEAHEITFFADGGTLLGAFRHQGFIPWDDDIDIIMTRREYDKLLAVSDEFKHPYFLQTHESDPMACRGHAQLRNSETTAILRNEMLNGKPVCNFNQGIFIDIFVLDNIPDNDKTAKSFMKQLSRLKKRIALCRNARCGEIRKKRKATLIKIRSFIWELFHSGDYLEMLQRKFDAMARRYEHDNTRRCSHLTFMPKPAAKYILDKSIFSEKRMTKFEFLQVPVPGKAEEYLSVLYGDWRKYVVGGSLHGEVFFDVDNPYRKYLA